MLDSVFQEITAQSLKNFIQIEGIEDIELNQSRDFISDKLKAKINANTTLANSFISYARLLEIGGRKDFYFFKFGTPLSAQKIQTLKSLTEAIPLEKIEDGITSPPDDESAKYLRLSKDTNLITIKAIRKKILSEAAPHANRNENGFVFRAFIEKEIRHVTYFEIDLLHNRIIVGVDVWKSLGTKAKLQEIESDINRTCGQNFFSNLILEDISQKTFQLLRNNQNVLTKTLSEKINDSHQSATFDNEVERMNSIKKGLNKGEISLGSIKTEFIENDIRDNEVFQAAEKQSIARITKGGEATLFYYSQALNRHEAIKFEIWAEDARIKFFNDYLTIDEIRNVFSEII